MAKCLEQKRWQSKLLDDGVLTAPHQCTGKCLFFNLYTIEGEETQSNHVPDYSCTFFHQISTLFKNKNKMGLGVFLNQLLLLIIRNRLAVAIIQNVLLALKQK